MKALVAARDDRILGFTMIGAEAGEVMPVVQMAMLRDCHIQVCAMPFSPIPPWWKGSGLYSPMCRRGVRNSGTSQSGIPGRSSQIGVGSVPSETTFPRKNGRGSITARPMPSAPSSRVLRLLV
jgi:hypothetical protein